MTEEKKCFMKTCSKLAEQRFTGGDESFLCDEHWLEACQIENELNIHLLNTTEVTK